MRDTDTSIIFVIFNFTFFSYYVYSVHDQIFSRSVGPFSYKYHIDDQYGCSSFQSKTQFLTNNTNSILNQCMPFTILLFFNRLQKKTTEVENFSGLITKQGRPKVDKYCSPKPDLGTDYRPVRQLLMHSGLKIRCSEDDRG